MASHLNTLLLAEFETRCAGVCSHLPSFSGNKIPNACTYGFATTLATTINYLGRPNMDFIVGLPPSGGKIASMVVVDKLSKYAYFIALPTQFTASRVASIFVAEIRRLHGIPKTIISDRDHGFMSHFWQE